MSKKHARGFQILRKALLENLERRSLTDKVFLDKVDEYMDLWERRKQLADDIERNGVSVFDKKRGCNVPNPCITLETSVSRQMLALYQNLGFKDIAVSAKMIVDGEDDEL